MTAAASQEQSYNESFLNQIVREIVIESSSSFFSQDVEEKAVEKEDDFVYGEVMSAILVHATEFVTLLKFHYSYESVSKLLTAAGMVPEDGQPTVSDIEDSMNELANLAGGRIIENLGTRGIQCSLSIPVTTPGYDEILSSDLISTHEYRDYFVLHFGECAITVTSSNKIKDASVEEYFKKQIETTRVESAFF